MLGLPRPPLLSRPKEAVQPLPQRAGSHQDLGQGGDGDAGDGHEGDAPPYGVGPPGEGLLVVGHGLVGGEGGQEDGQADQRGHEAPHDLPVGAEEAGVEGAGAPLEHALDVTDEALGTVDPGDHGNLDAACKKDFELQYGKGAFFHEMTLWEI